MIYIIILDGYESNEYHEQLDQNQNFKSGVYRHQGLGFGFIPHSVQGKTIVQGKPSIRVQGKNRITGAVFRVNRRSKPTSIEWVDPVGKEWEQHSSRRAFYQHRDRGNGMSRGTLTTRVTGRV